MSIRGNYSGPASVVIVQKNHTLRERFFEAATTGDILTFAAALQAGINLGSVHTSVPSWGELKDVSALCVKLAENQQRQDAVIEALQQRLAAVEAEFAPQHPLRGKGVLTPPPSSK